MLKQLRAAAGGSVLLALLGGCASNLAGTWQAQWPEGRREVVTLQEFGDSRWYLRGPAPELNGVYVFEDARLTCVKPDLPTMGGFAWRENSDKSFTLVEQPEPARLHDHWLGTRLVRHPGD